MLYVPSLAEYNWRLSTTAIRPTANYGTVVTPGNNTKGSYAQLIAGASVTEDVYFISININSNSVTTAIRDTILDIGIDQAGGTSYTVKIPDLLCSAASPYNVFAGGVWYHFPIFIKAGSSIGARASVNNSTVGTLRCWARLYGRPSRPEYTKVGHQVLAFGIVAASSRGTLITPGTTSEGAWTSLGAIGTSVNPWWWQLGYGVADASQGTATIHCDISAGNATTKKIIIEDQIVMTNGTEQVSTYPLEMACLSRFCSSLSSNTTVYARAQSSTTADSDVNMAAYGVL